MMMMMSRSRTRLLSKKSSKKRGTKRAAKRNSICSSFFSFVLFKTSLLLMILSAILMSENFEFFPVGVEGKKQRQKSSSSSSFEAFQNERREKRGTLGSRSVFLSHSVFLVVFFSRSRVRIVCVCYALQSTTTVNEFKTPFCFFLLQHSLITRVNVHIFLLCYILYFNNQNNHLIHNKRKQKNDES